MSDQLAPILERKPAIQVEMYDCSEADIQPILWGIEEEQIPVILNTAPRGGAADLAGIAAHASALNVGIAFDGAAQEVALHHRDLAGRPPLFTLKAGELSAEQLLRLGKNAARLVKGNPLDIEDRLPQPTSAKPAAAKEDPILENDQDALVQQLAERVLAQLFQR